MNVLLEATGDDADVAEEKTDSDSSMDNGNNNEEKQDVSNLLQKQEITENSILLPVFSVDMCSVQVSGVHDEEMPASTSKGQGF